MSIENPKEMKFISLENVTESKPPLTNRVILVAMERGEYEGKPVWQVEVSIPDNATLIFHQRPELLEMVIDSIRKSVAAQYKSIISQEPSKDN